VNPIQRYFLTLLSCALSGAVPPEGNFSPDEWDSLFRLARAQKTLPLIFEALCRTPEGKSLPQTPGLKREVVSQVIRQTQKTLQLHRVLEALTAAGLQPLVVKGLVCRNLYPQGDHRPSSDEDILIPPEQFDRCHEVLLSLGMIPEGDPSSGAYEIPYRQKNGVLYIELHRSLFPPESDAYGSLNRFFTRARETAVSLQGIPTLEYTDNLFYLICHAFKHFLHSGFGLRQVCDMILFANRYGSQIDWIYVLDRCRMVRAEVFAAGLLRIGWKYLDFSLDQSQLPLQWQTIYVNEAPLLEDILASGVYGNADEDRLHSSSITLNAVSAQKQGKTGAVSLLKTVFPSVKVMQAKYPYLKKKPLLLPVAWTDRLVRYGMSGNKPKQSVRIGNERIELLKKYGILDKT